MNILYLHAHDVGRFASVYGADVETPNLERFAASGATVFENAHAVAPTCSPSRTALLTGEYPHQQGMMGLTHIGGVDNKGHALKKPERHLAAWLRSQGYTTALCGVQHEFAIDGSAELPYDFLSEPDWSEGLPGNDMHHSREAVRWLESYSGEKPFFLSVGFYWPHVPLPEVSEAASENRIEPWPDVEEGRLDTAALQKAMNHTDRCMGQVLACLEHSRFKEDTLVLVTTDHGIPFPLNKATLHDRGTGVLFMLRAPGGKGVERSDALVSHLDLFPTVCELGHLDAPHWLQGESLVPVLAGKDTEREALFLETTYHVDYEPSRAIRTRTHKLIMHLEHNIRSESNVDKSRLKEWVKQQGFFEDKLPKVELFDLVSDPNERHNLASEVSDANSQQHELTQCLESLMEEFNDPYLAEFA
jgi:arylsulfatase A-like enzyme